MYANITSILTERRDDHAWYYGFCYGQCKIFVEKHWKDEDKAAVAIAVALIILLSSTCRAASRTNTRNADFTIVMV